ncbi:SRR1-like protein [Ciona intestinalis]
MENEWKTVSKKHRFKQVKKCGNGYILNSEQKFEETNISDNDVIHDFINSLNILKKSQKFEEFVKVLYENLIGNGSTDICQVVCYGIGSPSSSNISRYQLALLYVIHIMLSAPKCCEISFWLVYIHTQLQEISATNLKLESDVKCFCYDPVWNSADKNLIKQMGFCVLNDNEEGKRKTDVKTLYFMLHCDKWLYNNLLWSNWCHNRLNNMIIMGNSFNSIYERSVNRKLRKTYTFLNLVNEWDLMEEVLLPVWSKQDDVFNDTAVMRFNKTACVKYAANIETTASLDKPPEYLSNDI